MNAIRTPLSTHLLAMSREGVNLERAVCDYLALGLGQGEGALVITSVARWERILEALERRGTGARARHDAGRLVFLDSAKVLVQLRDGDALRTEALPRQVVPVLIWLRETTGQPTVRIYGDLVDTLFQAGDSALALQVERAWHDLLKDEAASLLCGCVADPLDPRLDAAALLPLCRAHSHLVPTAGASKRRRAVRSAIDAVLGSTEIGRLDMLLGAAGLPSAAGGAEEMALLWLRTEVPHLARRVLTLTAQELAALETETA